MTSGTTAAIVLAAGRGTRMKSSMPKVMHPVAGRAMIHHVLATLDAVEVARTVVVVGHESQGIAEAVAPVQTVLQDPPLGTGHAVLAARDALAGFAGDVLIVFGDTPLLRPATLERMIAARRDATDPAVVALGFRPADPAAYGRLVSGADGALEAIVEARDASPEQLEIGVCNAGIMAVDGRHLFDLLDAVGNDNAKGEYYLTDIVGLARARGLGCVAAETDDAEEVMGVNSRAELAAAEAVMQRRLRIVAMDGGVTMTDPDTVYLDCDTRFGQDVSVGPNVVFRGGVSVGDEVEIRAFCHIEETEIEPGAVIGPFARLRPGTRVGRNAHIGNFVEVKAAVIEEGAKANHLSYIGDARVGAGANIGAGTITCNYDGFLKSHTDIGAGAFIGSNTALVAPVRVGDGAIVGAGSVITADVKADALAVERAPQLEREGWAKHYRERKQAEKSESAGTRKSSDR